MKRAFNQTFIVISMTLLLFSVGGCGKKDPSRMSPMEIINLYYKSKDKGDAETLRRLIYFPPGTTDDQKEKRVKSELTGQDEKIMTRMFGGKVKAEYETILNENTAEVGVVSIIDLPGLKKRIPFNQIILKKEEGVWKFHHTKKDLTKEELINDLRANPNDSSAYFLLGLEIQSENPAKAHTFYKKYYDLTPNGFWISKEFLNGLKEFENTSKFEKDLLSSLYNIPQDSSDRAVVYRTVGQLYMELGDYKKTKMYFDKAEKSLRLDPDPLGKKRLKNSQQELELRLEGKYVDILKEAEMAYKKTR